MASNQLVVDSGYLMEAVLPTKQQWQLDALYLINAAAHGDIAIFCPYLLILEIGSVCKRKVKAKQLKHADASRLFDQLDTITLNVDIQIASPRNIYDFARKIDCQGYDGAYLNLALSKKLPIAARDSGVLAGARALKIPVWAPPPL